jgi:hypothetical protein
MSFTRSITRPAACSRSARRLQVPTRSPAPAIPAHGRGDDTAGYDLDVYGSYYSDTDGDADTLSYDAHSFGDSDGSASASGDSIDLGGTLFSDSFDIRFGYETGAESRRSSPRLVTSFERKTAAGSWWKGPTGRSPRRPFTT